MFCRNEEGYFVLLGVGVCIRFVWGLYVHVRMYNFVSDFSVLYKDCFCIKNASFFPLLFIKWCLFSFPFPVSPLAP